MHAFGDRLHDELRVPARAVDHRRRHRVEEVQADEVQPRLAVERRRASAAARRARRRSAGRSTRSPGSKPVHQITFVTSRMRPSCKTGRPSCDARPHAATRSTPAAARSFGFTRMSGPPWQTTFGLTRPADRRARSSARGGRRSAARAARAHDRLQGCRCERQMRRCRGPTATCRCVRGDFQRDLRARVARADDQHAARAELRRDCR